jgi:dTDP-4-dehydrorhamnose reductase
MKVLITGADSQLGYELQRNFKCDEIVITSLSVLDITNLTDVETFVADFTPDVILNYATYTNAYKCDHDRDTAFSLNSVAVKNLAVMAARVHAKLIHVSTDSAFPADIAEKQTTYKYTKLVGEDYVRTLCRRHFVVRVAYMNEYSRNNFVTNIINTLAEDKSSVVNNQQSGVMHTATLTKHLLKLAQTKKYGTYVIPITKSAVSTRLRVNSFVYLG